MRRDEIDQFQAAAYHEAGHTVLVRRHGKAILDQGVWINADGYGATHYHRLDPDQAKETLKTARHGAWERFRRDMVAETEIALAGWLAECRYHGIDAQAGRVLDCAAQDAVERIETTPFNDISVAANIIAVYLRAEIGSEAVMAGAVIQSYNRTKAAVLKTMSRPRTWSAIEAVADALLRRQRLDAPEIEDILATIPLPRAPSSRRRDGQRYDVASDRRSQFNSSINVAPIPASM